MFADFMRNIDNQPGCVLSPGSLRNPGKVLEIAHENSVRTLINLLNRLDT